MVVLASRTQRRPCPKHGQPWQSTADGIGPAHDRSAWRVRSDECAADITLGGCRQWLTATMISTRAARVARPGAARKKNRCWGGRGGEGSRGGAPGRGAPAAGVGGLAGAGGVAGVGGQGGGA